MTLRDIRFALAALALGIVASAAAFPVTVDSCGEPLTFDAPPRRAIVHDLNMAEMAFALGLQPHIVGVTGITGWYKTSPGFKAALGMIPELAPKYPTLENLLAAQPDFFFAGWYYGMKPGGDVTPTTLARYGVKTLVLGESCIRVDRPRPTATMELLYADMLKLGTIFGKRATAEQLVAQWKSRLDATKLRLGPKRDTRVFVYDSGEDQPFTAGRAAMPTALIETAGARNVMDDMPGSWASTSWETVATRNPQFLILLDYQDGAGPMRLLAFLKAHPAMQHTDAVRHNRYITLRYAEITPGPANIGAIEKLARALHGAPS